MLPNLLVIGAQKAGTTSLHRYLGMHPQVFMSHTNELMFFVEFQNWGRGVDWYESQFRWARPEHVAVGETSPQYTMVPHAEGVPERIKEVLGEPKLVYLVRDPVERARSHYVMRAARGAESRPVEEALQPGSDYVEISRYAARLEPYLERFPRENVLVVTSEALKGDRRSVLERIGAFLGLSAPWPHEALDPARVWNVAVGKRIRRPATRRALHALRYDRWAARVPSGLKTAAQRVTHLPAAVESVEISDEHRARLRDYFRDDVERLRPFLPEEFDGWGIA